MMRRKIKIQLILTACVIGLYICYNFRASTNSNRKSHEKEKVPTGEKLIESNVTFFKLKYKSLYIYSAYADVRFGHMVRMVGMAVKHLPITGLSCKISREGGTETVSASLQYLPEGHNLEYDAIYVLCKSHRPLTNGTKVGLSDHHNKPDFLLPVKVIPTVPSSSEQGMTVCYPPLHGNFDDVEQFVENIEMNLILGFRQFFVYVHKVGPRVRKAIASYAKEGIVHVMSWEAFPLDSGNTIHYMGQMVAINDCLYRAMNNPFRVVAFHDFDELIIPHVDRSLSDIVAKEMGPSVSGLSVRCAMFSLQLADDLRYADDRVLSSSQNSPRLWTQLKTKRLKSLFPHRLRSKMLVAADKVVTMGIHFEWNFHKGRAVYLEADVAVLHHYRAWGEGESVVDRTAWKYGQFLWPKVRHRLQKFNIQLLKPTSSPSKIARTSANSTMNVL